MNKLMIICVILSLTIIYGTYSQKSEKKAKKKPLSGQHDKLKGAFYTGNYRDVFLENGHSRLLSAD
jgi:hypothetical protein